MNLSKGHPKVLFFQADAVATEDEQAAMQKLLGAHIMPRNASVIMPSDNAEDADAVAGSVPRQYKHLATVTTYGGARTAMLKRMREKEGLDGDVELDGDLKPTEPPASVTPPPVGTEGTTKPTEPALGGSPAFTAHASIPENLAPGEELPKDGEKLGGAPAADPAAKAPATPPTWGKNK